MFIPSDRASRDLNALPNRIVDCFICNDDIASLAEAGNNARNRAEGLGIDDARRNAQVCGDIRLGLYVNILSTVEAGRATGANTIGAQGSDGFLLESLRGEEVVKVVGGEVRDCAAVGELGFGSRWAVW